MSKSTRGARVAGIASLAVSLSIGVAAPAFAVADFKFDRIAGADRYETSTLVDDEFRDGGADVILANGAPGNYADALSANTLAGEKNLPILLTRKDKTPASVLAQLKDDAVKNIWVVGGTSVVSDAQVASLTAAGYNVTRIAGSDRFGTNNEIIKMNGAAAGNTGLVATGFNFPDALAAGPFSFQGHPLALSTKDSIEDSTVQALKDAGVTKVLIFGGTTVVTPAVEAKLKAAGIDTAARFAGTDRADTSAKAAEYAVKNLGFKDTHVGVASGYVKGFGADALAGGPLEGKEKSPMLVTRDVDNPGTSVLDYLKAHSATLTTGHIYGGTAAVSTAAQTAMENAAKSAPASATSRPELVSAAILDTNTTGELGTDGTTVRFTFDEAIANATTGIPPAANLFYVYNSAGIADADGGDTVTEVSGSTVTVRFEEGVITDAEAAKLTVATVDLNAVHDPSGAGNPEGDAPLNTSTGGGSTTLPAGTTEGPDLVSIGGFAAAGTATDVEFVFDEAADAADATKFHLVGTNGTVYNGDNPVIAGSATKTVIVRFSETLAKADIARGVVDAGGATEDVDNDSDATLDGNPLQAADVATGGNSADPDLDSVELREASTTVDQALFTFDENIGTIVDATGFHLYKTDTTQATPALATDFAVNASNRRQVLVTFPEGSIDNAVGGQVDPAAVTGEDTNTNEKDEVGVANTGTTSGQTAGRTNGPDLTKVTVAQTKDSFGNVTSASATYTFDEPVKSPVQTEFFVYLADGTQLSADTCAVDNTTVTTDDDLTVKCDFNGETPVDRAASAVLGTVDNGAVTAVSGTPASNPEGAERVS